MATARKATARSKKNGSEKGASKNGNAGTAGKAGKVEAKLGKDGGFARDFTLEIAPLASITPYPANPRKHTDAGIRKLAADMRAVGWQEVILVDERRVIIAGHGRRLAALANGWTHAPIKIARGLSAAQVRAQRLADNRLAQESEWDYDLLPGEVGALRDEGFDLSLTGFDEGELQSLFERGSAILDGADVDAAPPVPRKAITRLGDRFQLGRHVLVCGDAKDPAVWDAALDGRAIGMTWTDPPYGVGYVGKTEEALTIDNDALSPEALDVLLRATFRILLARQRQGGAWYVSAPAGPLHLVFARVLSELGVWRQSLVWIKDRFVLGRSDYHYRHEALFAGEKSEKEQETMFYGWQEGAAHTWESDRRQDTVLEFPRPAASREHPTMKPVALVRYCIENSAAEGDLVVDPFAGSGTTMLAAEEAGRSSALIELSPAYCDVILARWTAATGQDVIRPIHAATPSRKARK